MSSGFKIVLVLIALIAIPAYYFLLKGPDDPPKFKDFQAAKPIESKKKDPGEEPALPPPTPPAAPATETPMATDPVADTTNPGTPAPATEPAPNAPAPAPSPAPAAE